MPIDEVKSGASLPRIPASASSRSHKTMEYFMIRMSENELRMLRSSIMNRIPMLVTGFTKVQGEPWPAYRVAASMHRARELFRSFDADPNTCVMTTQQEQEAFELLINLKFKLLSLVELSNDRKQVVLPCGIEAQEVASDVFELRSALIAVNTPLVFSVTNKWKEKYINEHDMEDRCSLCNQILIKCVDLFNPYFSTKFSTFAVNSLKREVFRDQEKCNNRKTRFRLKEDIEPSIKYKAQSLMGDVAHAVDVSRIMSKVEDGVKFLRDPLDEEVIRRLITHLNAGGTLKTFEKDPSIPSGRVREVLIRVRNQYKPS